MIEFLQNLYQFMDTHPLIVMLLFLVIGVIAIGITFWIENLKEKSKNSEEKKPTEELENDFNTKRKA